MQSKRDMMFSIFKFKRSSTSQPEYRTRRNLFIDFLFYCGSSCGFQVIPAASRGFLINNLNFLDLATNVVQAEHAI